MATITGINAGTTIITASYGGKTATAEITVGAVAPSLSFSVNQTSLTYNGSAQKLGTVSYNGDGTVYYIVSTSSTVPAANDSAWAEVPSNNEITYTNAGTYYVHLKATAGSNYTAVNPKLGNSTGKEIAKRTVSITAPTFVSGTLTYDGTPKTIASGGSCSTGGTMYYYVSTSSTAPTVTPGTEPGTGWTTTDPQVTDKGTYYVWYYCYVPDTANNGGTNINTVKAVSGSKAVSARTVTVTAPTATDKTYTGSAQTIFEAGSCSDGGVMYYSSTNSTFSTSTWSTTVPNASQTNAGTYTLYYYCYVVDTANNTGSNINTVKSVEATIAKKSTAAPVLTAGGNSTYTGTTYYAQAANGSGNPAGKIYYGATSGAETYNITASSTAANLTSMGRSDVGTTTIYAFFRPNDTANYEDSSVANTTVTISNKVAGYATASIADKTYNGSAQTIATASTYSGDYYFGLGTSSTVAPSSWGSKNTALSQTDAGTYYVWMKTDESTNYSAVSPKYIGTVTIAQRTISFTEPTAIDRTYNGSAQTIFEEGSCGTGGTMYYNTSNTVFSTSTWSTTLPYSTKTNAGDYTIYYYCYVPDTTNNTGSGTSTGTPINTVASISATIFKKSTSAPELTAGSKNTYDGSTVYAKAANVSGNPAGTIYYAATSGATSYSMSVNAGATTAANMTSMGQTSVGTKTIYAFFRPNDTTNYSDSAIVSTTAKVLNKANLTVTEVNYSGTYDGSSHSSTVMVTNTDWTGKTIVCGPNTSYGTTITNNGTPNNAYALKTETNYTASTTVYYKITGDTNYNDYTDSVTFSLAKAAGYITADTDNKTYNGSAQTIATKLTNSGDYYFGLGSSASVAPSSWGSKNDDLSATNAGTYYVWMKADASTNYSTVDATYIGTVTISQRTVTVTAPTAEDKNYTGSAQTIFTAGSATAGGVMYYSTSDVAFDKTSANWSTTIPYTQQTAAGTYTIYWYCLVEDTANNTGTNINTKNTLTAEIISTAATLPSTWSGDSVEYHNTAVLTATGYSGGTLKYRYDENNGTNWTETTTAPTRDAVGTTAVQCMVVGDVNHTDSAWSSTVTLTVYKADDARMTVTPGSSLTYNDSAKNIATASNLEGIGTYYLGYKKDSEATAESQITWGNASTTPLTATGAGTYYIYYKFTPDGNHDNVNEATVGTATYVGSATIAKASRSGAVSCNDVTYGSTVTATVSGNTENGAITWSITNGTGTATIDSTGKVTPTQAGTVTVNATVAATDNYDSYIATPKVITISKAAGTVTYSTVETVQVYCRTDAVPADTAYGDKTLTIATNSASGATGAVSYSISQSGWSIANDGLTIEIPDGTPAGTYNITVSAISAETTNYLEQTATNSITVYVIAQALERIELTLAESTISFNGTTTATVVAVYTNGATADVTSHNDTTYSSNPTGIVTITK